VVARCSCHAACAASPAAAREAILRALTDRVTRLDAGEPVRHYNNVLRGLESLAVTVATD